MQIHNLLEHSPFFLKRPASGNPFFLGPVGDIRKRLKTDLKKRMLSLYTKTQASRAYQNLEVSLALSLSNRVSGSKSETVSHEVTPPKRKRAPFAEREPAKKGTNVPF